MVFGEEKSQLLKNLCSLSFAAGLNDFDVEGEGETQLAWGRFASRG